MTEGEWTRQKPLNRIAIIFLQSVLLIMISIFLGQSLGGEYSTDSSSFLLPWLDEKHTTPQMDTSSDTEMQSRHPESLEIAWLLSFPNSGTSYTLHLVKSVSQTNTATNYAKMRAAKKVRHGGSDPTESIPVFDNQPTGPFWSDPLNNTSIINSSTDKPTAFVLTKTHCGAPCEWCPPEKYAQMLHHFQRRCASTESITIEQQEDGTAKRSVQKGVYPLDKVTRAVHLIRDPFDNIVSRFRYERSNNRTATEYPANATGFRQYCFKLNQEFQAEHRRGRYIDQDIVQELEGVPCYADFLRYVEWHNMAFIIARDLELDTHVLHYEGYSSSFNETTAALLDFLQLQERGEAPYFEPFKTYRSYFTMEEQAVVRFALQQTALKETWRYLRKYFRAPSGKVWDS
jgi:Sulfotransferase domain